MQIEMRLKQVLEKYQLDCSGIKGQIAKDAGIHRHTVAKVYENKAPNVSLETIGKLCDWLQSKGVPEKMLPQALFGGRSSSLWKTIAKQKAVTLYLGEYQQDLPAPRLRWIARRDAFVHSKIVEQLSSQAVVDGERLTFHARYIPFHLDAQKSVSNDVRFLDSVKRSKEALKQMRSQRGIGAAILIGSQLVNYMVEHFVADLFETAPFQAPKQKPVTPFYMAYREKDRNLPSCFGGPGGPADHKGPVVPGIYYRGDKGKWNVIEWIADKQDAGILITVYDARSESFEMVVFGFSGVGTAAMGEKLARTPDRFWVPVDKKRKGKQIQVYACKIGISSKVPDQTEEEFYMESVDVVKEYRL